MPVWHEDMYWMRLPLLDVREQDHGECASFRLFDLYMLRGHAEYLIALARELEERLAAAPPTEAPDTQEPTHG